MKAAILEEPRTRLVTDDIDIAKPWPREVLVRTAAVGLCHSDLHTIDATGSGGSKLPVVLGHEVAGVVEQVGSDVTRLKPGDHVVGCLSVFCGHCDFCVTGQMVLCSTPEVKMPPGAAKRLSRRGQHVNQAFNLSGFAEQMLVHEHALVKIRKDMPLDRAALIGCGVLTGTGAAFQTAKVEPGSTCVVIGCGGVGLSCIMGASMAGALRVIAVDRLANKLALAKEFGATDVIDASAGDIVEQVKELMPNGVHYAFECIGLKKTAEQGSAMLRSGGTLTVMGVMPASMIFEIPGRDFLRQKRIQGSIMGSNHFPVDIPRLVDFYMQGRLPLDKMISQRLPLDKINEGFDDLRKAEVARSVITFPGVGGL